jgi:hypothetical protein
VTQYRGIVCMLCNVSVLSRAALANPVNDAIETMMPNASVNESIVRIVVFIFISPPLL